MAEDTKFTYHFDWDPVKAQSNLADHKVSFRLASSVLRDPDNLGTPSDQAGVTGLSRRIPLSQQR